MQERITYSFTADSTGAVARQQVDFVLGAGPSVVPVGWITRYKAVLQSPAVNTNEAAFQLPAIRLALDFGAGGIPIPPAADTGRSVDLVLWAGTVISNSGVIENVLAPTGTWTATVTPFYQLGGNILPGPAPAAQVEGVVSSTVVTLPKMVLPTGPGMRAWATMVYDLRATAPVTSAQWALDLDVWIDAEQV